MTGTVFTAVMAVIAIITGVLAFSSEIKTKTPALKFIDKLWFKIMLAIIIAVGTMFATIMKDNRIEADNKKEQDKRDKINTKKVNDLIIFYSNKVDSTYINIVKASNDALAKYSLKLDDSLHTVVRNIKIASEPFPFFDIDSIVSSKETGFWHITYWYSLYGAPAFDIDLKSYLVTFYDGQYYANINMNNNSIFLQEISLPPTLKMSAGITLKPYGMRKKYLTNLSESKMFMWLIGSYKNVNGKLFKIDKVYGFHVNEIKIQDVSEFISNDIREYVNKIIKN